jgi:hypothetical protein
MTAEEEAELSAEREAWEKAQVIVEGLLDGYERGELEHEKFCRYLVRAAEPLKSFAMLGARRQQLIGAALERASKITPPKRGKGNSGECSWLRERSRDLVRIVQRREGLPVNQASIDRHGQSAFERVADLWRSAGMKVSAAQVKRWVYAPISPVPKKSKN